MNTYGTPHAGCACPAGYVRDQANGHPERACPFYGLFGTELRDAHAAADVSRGLECSDLDLDRALTDHREHCKRGARTLMARANRLQNQEAELPELEGLRVEILSYRDRFREQLSPTYLHDLVKTAMKLGDAVKTARTVAPKPEPILERLAMSFTSERRADVRDCDRCGQTFIPHTGSTRCTSCDAADHDQGDQLGMFELPATPTNKTRAQRAPQPEGLFT